MTVGELIEEVYSYLGEPTYLSPYNGAGVLDSTTSGYRTILRWLNQAVRAVATWKDRSTGTQLRFYPFVQERIVKPRSETPTVTAASTNTLLYTNSTFLDAVGATLIYGNEARTIVRATLGEIELNKGLQTVPTVGETVTIRRPVLEVPQEERLIEVLKVVDEKNETELERAEKGELFLTTRNTVGVPSQWARMGAWVYLDSTPKEDMWYRLVCYALPEPLTSSNQTSGLPVQYDTALILYATGLGFLRMQEMTAKYSVMQDFENYMRTTQNQEDVHQRLQNGVLWIMEE